MGRPEESEVRTTDGACSRHPAACAAVLVDRLVGEPRRWHPLVGFGRLAAAVERRLNPRNRRDGVLAWVLVLLPWVALAAALRALAPVAVAVDVVLLAFALGARSLSEHAEAVRAPLARGSLDEARRRVALIVSRDTGALDEEGVSKPAVESVLENGNDAVFGALFWFAVLGGPGALLFRLANTLDAMWGALAGSAAAPNLVVLRSLGKFFGLAGARVGFVFAAQTLLERLAERVGPWAVSGPAREVARLALLDAGWQGQARHLLEGAAGRLEQRLARLGPVQATRLFASLRVERVGRVGRVGRVDRAEALAEHLATRGLLVRSFQGLPLLRFGLSATEAGWQRLERALCEWEAR